MRYFFTKYEQAEYWLYKEEIYEGIKNQIPNYNLEECERDLQFLIDNKSLTRLQDTPNIYTLNDFKYHNFRYQMTDRAVIIERMTIDLEELEVKISTLEPRLFERINHLIKQLTNIYEKEESKIYEIWTDLNNDFKNLNQQYQDFLKNFMKPKPKSYCKVKLF